MAESLVGGFFRPDEEGGRQESLDSRREEGGFDEVAESFVWILATNLGHRLLCPLEVLLSSTVVVDTACYCHLHDVVAVGGVRAVVVVVVVVLCSSSSFEVFSKLRFQLLDVRPRMN